MDLLRSFVVVFRYRGFGWKQHYSVNEVGERISEDGFLADDLAGVSSQ